ncbi:glycosyltransferase [Paenibacillus sp. JNUCC32]|uniref:glycosyltransferase family 2 protein n=1 Tax=Paenibacillus sp. JNUCC32 TaxID=2777984 RepID=UPI0017887F2D|nr:glycosyltransferase [Paenibacillus sp. JNUCC-32]QOT09871.1 glycosyltransferase [Paenibacillus sp. JNUCC-32]
MNIKNIYYAFIKYFIRFKTKVNVKQIVTMRSINWYGEWIDKNEKYSMEEISRECERFIYKPLISILVPVYNVKESYLRECLDSVCNQVYNNWELCIADDNSSEKYIKEILEEYRNKDPRIKVAYREVNGNISACSNTALSLADGDFVALLDNDDILSPVALYEVVSKLNDSSDIDVIYSDEDKLLDGKRVQPFFKKKWNINLLSSVNFICHFVVYRISLVRRVGGFRIGYEGAQDWDLAIRITNLTDKIAHIPKMLYHWRISTTSTSGGEGNKPYIKEVQDRMLKSHF